MRLGCGIKGFYNNLLNYILRPAIYILFLTPPLLGADITAGESFNGILQNSWSYAFDNVYGGFYRMIPGPSAAIGELRSDFPGLEIVSGNEEYFPLGDEIDNSPLGRWFMFSSDGRVIWWKDTENDEAHSSMAFSDINGDGEIDIVGGTTSGNQVQSFQADKSWNWIHPDNGHVLSTPALARVGRSEWRVISGSFDYSIKGLRGTTGQTIWRFGTRGPIWSSAAVGDLDANGEKEVIIGSDDGYLYCLGTSTGALRWQRQISGEMRASAALADINGDGRRDIVVGTPWISSGTVLALEASSGKTIWQFQTSGSLISSPAIGDVDGDGRLDIVIGSGDGYIYCLNNDGTLKWKTNLRSPIYSSPALAQRGPQQRLDVYIATYAGYLSVINGQTGSLIDSFKASYTVVSSPIVGDINGDGKLEILFQDRYGDINNMRSDRFWCVTDTQSQVPPFSRPWPMFRANPSHTGLYNDNETETFISKPDQIPPTITHAPVKGPWNDSQSISITAQITDNIGVEMVGLTFWETGTQKYNTIPMNKTGMNKYSGIIPAFFLQGIKNKSISYFIDATDDAGNYPPLGQTPGTFAQPNIISIYDVSIPTSTIWNPKKGKIQGKIANWSGGFSPADVTKVQLRLLHHQTGNYWNPTGWHAQESWFGANYLRLGHQSNMVNDGTWGYQGSIITFSNNEDYTLWTRAVDSSGNQGAVVSSVTFKTDTQLPVIQIESPESGTTYYGTLTRFNGSVQDEQSGISYMYLVIKDLTRGLTWDGSSWQSYYAYVQPSVSGSTWTYQAPLLTPNRQYEIVAFAMDKAQNAKTQAVRFSVDSPKLPSPEKTDAGWAWTSADHLDRQFSWQSSLSTANVKSYRVYVQNPGQSFFTMEREVMAALQNFEWTEQSSSTIILNRNAATKTYTYTVRRPGKDWPVGRWNFYVTAISHSNIESDPSMNAFLSHAGPTEILLIQGNIPTLSMKNPLANMPGYLDVAFFTQPNAWILGNKVSSRHQGEEIIIDTLNGNPSTDTLKTGTTYYVQTLKKINDPVNGETVSLSRRKWILNYDGQAPVSKITQPLPGEILASLSRLAGTAQDTGGGLAQIKISIQRLNDSLFLNESQWTPSVSWITAEGTNNWEVLLSSSALSQEGSYRVVSMARDTSGNRESFFPELTFQIDRTAPETSASLKGLLGTNGFYTSTVLTVLKSNDAVAGVKKIMLRLDQGPWQIYSTTYAVSANGNHLIEYYAIDQAGNEEPIKKISFAEDLTPPESAIDLFSDTHASGTGNDNFSGVISVETALLDLTLNKFWNSPTFSSSSPNWTSQAITSGAWTMNIPPLTQSHSYELWTRARDQAGLEENPPKKASKLYDVAAPVSRVNAPAQGSLIRHLSAISGTAKDDGSGLQRILICLERLSDQKTLHPEGWQEGRFWHQIEGKEEWSWPMPKNHSLTEGHYQTISMAVDKNGNLEINASTTTFSFDDIAPVTTITLTGAQLIGNYYNGALRVALVSQDNLSGASLTHYRIDYQAELSTSSVTPSEASLGFGSWKNYQEPFTVSNSGKHTVEFYSVDKIGNTQASQKIEFNIDAEGPEIAITNIRDFEFLKEFKAVEGAALDAASGISQIEISVNSQNLGFLNSDMAWQNTPAWLDAGKKSPWSVSFNKNLPEGSYQITARAADATGHQSTLNPLKYLFIDQTPPISQARIIADQGRNGWLHGPADIILFSTDTLSGVQSTSCRLLNQEFTTNCSSVKISNDGRSAVEFYSTDKAQNQETVKTTSVSIDTRKPTSIIDTLTMEQASGAAFDMEGSGIESILISLRDASNNMLWNGSTFTTLGSSWITLATTGPWSFSMPPLTSGHRYEFEIRAQDASGWLQESPARREFTYDLTPPVSKITNPLDHAILGNIKSINGTALDEGSGIASVEIQLKRLNDNFYAASGGWNSLTGALHAQLNKESWTIDLPTGLSFIEGKYSVLSWARDLNGNLEVNPGPIEFTIDATPPQTTAQLSAATSSNSYHTSSINISLSGFDSLSGIREIRYRLNAESWQSYLSTITINLSGKYNLEFFGIDKAANEEKTSTKTFLVDLDRPTISIAWPVSQEAVTPAEIIEISGQANDALSGVQKVDITLTEIFPTSEDEREKNNQRRGEPQILSVNLNPNGIWTAAVKSIKGAAIFEIKAVAQDNAGLTSSVISTFSTTIPPGNARATIKNPDEGKKVSGNAVTIMAEATENTKAVLFQYKADSDRDWSNVTSRDEKLPFSVYWNVSALANGPYYLRAIAYDSNDLADPHAASIRVEVSDVNADVHEDGNPDVDPNNEHRKTETVKPDESKEVSTADGTKASIPSGAVPKEDKIKIKSLSASTLPVPLPPVESGLKTAGVFREFTFESGLKTFQTPITLTLPYSDDDNDGYVDGTDIHESELRLYYFDETSRQWTAVTNMERFTTATTRVSAAGAIVLSHEGKRVEARLDHFTLFALFAVRLAATAANVIVYPNPAIVAQGMRTITFDALPVSGKIQIYSIAGRLVKEIEYGTSNAGRWSWDLNNDQGESVASGAYLYIVTDTNGIASRGKIAIVR